MPSPLALPKQDVAIADAQTLVPTSFWYDWFLRVQRAVFGASTSASLTVTAGTGTITTKSATIKYKQIGRYVFFDVSVTITTNGTGAGSVRLSGLPFTALRNASIYGIETNVSGKALTGALFTASNQIWIFFYDATYPGADGATLAVSGFCEVN